MAATAIKATTAIRTTKTNPKRRPSGGARPYRARFMRTCERSRAPPAAHPTPVRPCAHAPLRLSPLEFLGQRDDDARGQLADEFGAVGAQAIDSVVDAFDCKHDAPDTVHSLDRHVPGSLGSRVSRCEIHIARKSRLKRVLVAVGCDRSQLIKSEYHLGWRRLHEDALTGGD